MSFATASSTWPSLDRGSLRFASWESSRPRDYILPRISTEFRIALAAGNIPQMLEVRLDLREFGFDDRIIDPLAIDDQCQGASGGYSTDYTHSGLTQPIDTE